MQIIIVVVSKRLEHIYSLKIQHTCVVDPLQPVHCVDQQYCPPSYLSLFDRFTASFLQLASTLESIVDAYQTYPLQHHERHRVQMGSRSTSLALYHSQPCRRPTVSLPNTLISMVAHDIIYTTRDMTRCLEASGVAIGFRLKVVEKGMCCDGLIRR